MATNQEHPPVALWVWLRAISIPIALLAFLYDKGGRVVTSLRDFVSIPWSSYDSQYYIRIVQGGYESGGITSGFHPLYPWISALVAMVTRDSLLGLMLVASGAGLVLTIAFYRLARLDHNPETAWTATALLLCWPASVALFVPYTEALFLLLAVSCLLTARKGHFWVAGLLGGLAALTRQHGIFLALALAWELWEAFGRDWRKINWRTLPSILLVPAGYALWIAYRAFVISDVKPDFSSLQGFIFSVMVSPTAYDVFKDQQFVPPWIALWKAIIVFSTSKVHLSSYGDLILGVTFISMFIFSWRCLRTSYRIYSLAVVLVALSYHTGSLDPYVSLPRHMLPAFPVFIGVAAAYKFRRLPFILAVLALCQMLFLCCFVWQTWVL